MKKTTLLFSAFLLSVFSINAQTISFEASEGFTLGNINGQNNWEVTMDGDGEFMQNQVISNEVANHGDYSLKIVQEPEYPGNFAPIVGAYYNFDQVLTTEEVSFSADVYISSQQGMSGLSFLFGLVDIEEERYRTYVNFAYDGAMQGLVQSEDAGRIERVDLGTTWQTNTWHNIKIETEGDVVTYYFENEIVHVGELPSTGNIHQVRFLHDNYEGAVFIDNFIINDGALSLDNFEAKGFAYFYDSNNQTLNLKSQDAHFTSISMFNVLGQEVLNQKLAEKTETLDMSGLGNGVYIVKVNFEGGSKVIKVLKQ